MGMLLNMCGYNNEMFNEKDGVFVDAPEEIEDLLTEKADEAGVVFNFGQVCRIQMMIADPETDEDPRKIHLTVRLPYDSEHLQLLVPKSIAHNFPARPSLWPI